MGRNSFYGVPKVLIQLAEAMNIEVVDWHLAIPPAYGEGYCKGYVFNEHIRMLVLDYRLNEELVLTNPDKDTVGRTILFKFRNMLPVDGNAMSKTTSELPSVLIATSRIDSDQLIPVHSNRASINIEVDASYLQSLFRFSEPSPILQSLIDNTQPLLFDQLLHASIQKVVHEMFVSAIGEPFTLFYLRVKAEELICRLLVELEKRDEEHIYDLNSKDIDSLYQAKEILLADLSDAPSIDSLALTAGMSASKLKRLFKQVFGKSIFSYYQDFRMQEAARLLRNEKLAVSEVGYRLGFTNLSHFTRVFKEHIGVNPKRYTKSKFE